MTEDRTARPIFFVGMGRSGSSLIYELFSVHPDLAWFSHYLNRWPRFPSLAVLSRLADVNPVFRRTPPEPGRTPNIWLERARIRPSEAYGVWRHYVGQKFLFDALSDAHASAQERDRIRALVVKVARYQGKRRFVAKVTGPPRIRYLGSIFDDAYFVHLVRDGRAVVRSLMNVPFWRDTFRMREPSWRNGLSAKEIDMWRASGGSPLALAAIQWCAMVTAARREADALARGRYAEFRYEDFVRNPHGLLDEIVDFCALPPAERMHDYLETAGRVVDRGARWREAFEPDDLQLLDGLMGETLAEFGYGAVTPRPNS
jgi:hypothetical protein